MKKITNELIQKFKTYLMEEEKSAATLEKYIRDIIAFVTWLCEREIDKQTVLEYKAVLKEKYAPASVNSILSSLNSFFAYNEWYGLKVKTIKIQRQIFASSEKELTKEEYNRLLIAAKNKKNQRLYYLMQAICSTGIRVSEHRFLTVESLNVGQATIDCKGKTRIVIIPQQLCKMLKKYVKEQGIESGPIFVTKSGKPLNRTNIWNEMKKICETAGVSKDKVFPHNLRHLFARTYYSLQKDVVRLADILGHSSVNTTRIYTIESGIVHKKQIEKLGLLHC